MRYRLVASRRRGIVVFANIAGTKRDEESVVFVVRFAGANPVGRSWSPWFCGGAESPGWRMADTLGELGELRTDHCNIKELAVGDPADRKYDAKILGLTRQFLQIQPTSPSPFLDPREIVD